MSDNTENTQNDNAEEVTEEKKAVDFGMEITWEDLVAFKNDAAQALLSQQRVLVELSKQHKSQIGTNQELAEAITGLNNSFTDIAKDIRATMEKHGTVNDEGDVIPFTGVIEENSDSHFQFVGLSNEYIVITEKIANLATIALSDIFATIKTVAVTAEVAQAYDEASKDLQNVKEEAIKEAVKEDE